MSLREAKTIKRRKQKKKEELINKMNPGWKDLWDEVQDL